MTKDFARNAAVVVIGVTGLAVLALVATNTGHLSLGSAPTSGAETCVGGSSLVPTLFGNDLTTQIRVSTQDLKSQRVLRTEPANRLPGLFQSLLSVSPDGSKLAYITADDEQLDNARLSYIDIAKPETVHQMAFIPFGTLPVRPVWSPAGDQVAFVIARANQGQPEYRVLAASTNGGQLLRIATLSPNGFASLSTSLLCVTPAGSVSMLPPPTLANGAVGPVVVSPNPTPAQAAPPSAAAGAGGGTRCELPVLSQTDPQWANMTIDRDGESIGAIGCAVTSAAMVLDYYSANLTPRQLAECLGDESVPISWSKAAACTHGLVSGATRMDFSWAGLDAILAAGRPAIVGLHGGTVKEHFVVVMRGGGDVADRYHIVDPWNGRINETLGDYTRSNSVLKYLIDFRGTGPGCGKLLQNFPDPVLSVVSGFSDGGLYHNPVIIKLLDKTKLIQLVNLSRNGHGGSLLTLQADTPVSEDGNYQVRIYLDSVHPIVLSFTIDNAKPTLSVKFDKPLVPLRLPDGSTVSVVTPPVRFEISASDPLTRITDISGQLDKVQIAAAASVAGAHDRPLTGVIWDSNVHQLYYSATNAAMTTASGSMTFVVANLPSFGGLVPPGFSVPGGGANSSPPPLTNNSSGTGSSSSSGSGSGTGTHTALAPTVPGPPRSVLAVAMDGWVGLSWQPPASDSGVTGYVITMSPGGGTVASMSFNSGGGSAIINKLTNRTAYTFTVAAKNPVGVGAATTSNTATPYCSGVPLTSATIQLPALFGYSYTGVSWSGNGSCGPYTGTLTATYNVSFPAGTKTVSYPFTTGAPLPCSGYISFITSPLPSPVKFTLVVTDTMGHSVTTTLTG